MVTVDLIVLQWKKKNNQYCITRPIFLLALVVLRPQCNIFLYYLTTGFNVRERYTGEFVSVCNAINHRRPKIPKFL